MSFKSLGLSDNILKAIDKKGYTNPSPIQLKAIPVVLEGKDVLASAQTGTGKTAGFTLPILELLSKKSFDGNQRKIRSLILTPTRELAAQVYENVKEYSEFLPIRSTVIFGGVGAKPQIDKIRNGIDILVATPGRLLDLHNQRVISLANIEVFVLDEADRMLDMGFVRDIEKVLSYMPERRQNLMFSATFSKEIKRLANGILDKPVAVETAAQNTTAERVNQTVYRLDKGAKPAATIKLISDGNWDQVLIFTRTKHGANRLSEKLHKSGISSAAIHGNKSQNARTKALAGFKDGSIRTLVATDIAARGLDIPLLPYVINFELPNIPEDYVHRIGRTGRAGASGDAISLVSLDEVEYVRGIEKLLSQKIESKILAGFEPQVTEIPEEDKKENQRGGRTFGRSRNQSSRGGSSKSNSTRSNSGGSSRGVSKGRDSKPKRR